MSSTTVKNTLLAKSEPSICIPRTFPNITWQMVKYTFEQLFGVGCIRRVDMVHKTTPSGEKFQRVFVHFKEWNDDTQTQSIRQKLLDGEEIKLVYDDPWFWKCSASRVAKPETRTRAPRVSTPFIKTDEVHENSPKKPTQKASTRRSNAEWAKSYDAKAKASLGPKGRRNYSPKYRPVKDETEDLPPLQRSDTEHPPTNEE